MNRKRIKEEYAVVEQMICLVCVIGTGFTCFSSVIVENAIVILTLFRKEQINAVDATHTEAYQRNILSKFLERMRESTEVGNNGEEPAKHIGAYCTLVWCIFLGYCNLGPRVCD